MKVSVDVAINVYGKPFQTAVALLSLVKHSGQHIGKIYFVKEPKQPADVNFQFIYDLLSDKIVVFTPDNWNWVDRTDTTKLGNESYRRSLRYQYAWEESEADFLFVTHNDVLYEGDIIGEFLANIGDSAGIGEIGQCWNCPASAAGGCNGDRYWDFRPSVDELNDLYEKFPSGRIGWETYRDDPEPWPLPECRLNEWTALINLTIAKPETIPIGAIIPFGAMTLDIGTGWFRGMSSKGFRFANYRIAEIAKHGWTHGGGGGHQALFQYEKYESDEEIARAALISEFGIDARTLAKVTRGKWKARLQTMLRKWRR